jgi:chromosome segregation ATPase
LEASLEDARRRLVEEKQVKDNFQDLLTAMHEQIEQHKNERDNLKDEIVPQLKARVEGLEADAAETEKVHYDNSRLQQEISALRNENNSLKDARRMQMEMQQQASRFSSIAEEGAEPPTPFGLKRSNSTARTPTGRGASLVRSPSLTGGSLSRSNSLSGKDRETKESLADRMKDVEMQRDALHQAVKSLLDRQAYQTRENEKRIKILEAERDKALQARSPRRMGYEKEVGALREEINHLRRRGDDALEQRWQCEKGLGGLKMDLDRAEQETMSLRSLLKAHDILLPDRSARSEDPFNPSADEATSSSLRTALTHLEADRAAAAEGSASRSLAEEQRLADQLSTSSQRVQDLAKQVQVQLSTNHTLRARLAEAVGRGEREQKSSATRINALQSKLKRLEDTVMVAQQQSEDSITKHESEIAIIKESHNSQLLRVKSGLRTPATFSPKSPLSPMFAKTPRLDHTTSGVGIGLSEKVRTEVLEKKVQELERALKEADGEMAEVVGRMNAAQIEVAELQSDRYVAKDSRR